MKWQLVVGVLLGVAWAGVALADEDFGDDDHEVPMLQEIHVPDLQDRVEEFSQVPAALVVLEGVAELPFELLDVKLDGDGDGLSDVDEVRLATDADNPDTDGDGYIDGLEVVRGYNPLRGGPGDKVVFTGLDEASASSDYRVTGVRLEAMGAQEVLVVTGVGPANSLVMLLVFSEDIRAWVVRADGTGRFLYTSADTLGAGSYRVQAAGTAAGGEVLAASVPLSFVRTVEGLEILVPTPAPVSAAAAVGERRFSPVFISAAAAFLAVLIFAVVFVGWRWVKVDR